MSSDVTICNAALAMLGDNPIQTLTGAEKAAKACNAIYASTRDRLLRQMQPTCARKRTVLAALAAVPPGSSWGAQFQLPSDYLRLLQVGPDGIRTSYSLEGGRILAAATSLEIVYVFRNTDPQTWDSQFEDLMVHAMAAALAYPITKSASLRNDLTAAFERMRKMAGAVNGQESEPEDLPDSTIQTARY